MVTSGGYMPDVLSLKVSFPRPQRLELHQPFRQLSQPAFLFGG
jgi:hypothetical protein